METYAREDVGRYAVRVLQDDSMYGTGYYHARDCENAGRISVPGDRDRWYFQDDSMTYREAREQAGEPILAIPVDIWEQSYCIIRARRDWDGADGFYWAPMSRASDWADGISGMRACMVAEIETLASELQGDVWGYVVETPDGHVVDSCWGYIGEPDYALQEGKSVAEYLTYRDACIWAELPDWVRRSVLIGEEVNA